MTLGRAIAAAGAATIIAAAPVSRAQVLLPEVPAEARGADVIDRVGERLPLATMVIDVEGNAVEIGRHFRGDRPVILILAYYSCPVACPAIMGNVVSCLNGLDMRPGREFEVVTLSFAPYETPEMARQARQDYIGAYAHRDEPGVRDGWSFYVAPETSIARICDAVGFVIKPMKGTRDYAHPTGLFIMTPDGRVSRFMEGFNYPPRDVRLALLEAGEGKLVRSLADRILLFCYHYDPTAGRYTLQAMRVMQLGGLATVIALGTLIAVLRLRDPRRAKRRAEERKERGGVPRLAGSHA